jgi:hypothetical protein
MLDRTARVVRDVRRSLASVSLVALPFLFALVTFAVVTAALVTAACARGPSGPPAITLQNGTIEITGLAPDTLRALAALPETDWPAVFRVGVSPDAPPMLGAYSVEGNLVRFVPAFPLDAGRQYDVRFEAAKVPGTASGVTLAATVGRPAEFTTATTTVTRVYPTGDEVPENILRMYVEFSAPMGRKSGVEHLTLLDHGGKVIPGAVLPLDYEFWSPDHTRFTVFFDPGRVKDGILPNREMGRAFTPGTTVTLVVSKDWRDAHGLPLVNEFRRTFTVTPADTRPLDPSTWRITAPAAASRDALVVAFGKSLDRSLLLRALGVRREGDVVEGETEIGPAEASWRFTPRVPWQRGEHQFLALDILEDVAGNQVGRAFEVDNFESVDKDPDPKQVLLSFVVK